MNGIKDSIREMKKDYTHGSSWYYERISQLLVNVDQEGLTILLRSLGSIRPGMGSIANIEEVVKREKVANVYSARPLGQKLSDYSERCKIELNRNLEKLNGKKIMTISYSSAIRRLIERSPPDKLVLLDSKPGKESRTAAKNYGKFCKVMVVPDSSMYSYMNSVDLVVTGFDGLYANGFLTNKVGTYPLYLSAREAGIEVLAIGESFKSTINQKVEISERNVRFFGRRYTVPLLESVPLKYVDRLVTDQGQFIRPDFKTVELLHDAFLQGVK